MFDHLRSTKPVMPNALDGLGLGRARKAGPILQCGGREILRVRERSVGYGIPNGMEGRTRARHPVSRVWLCPVSLPPCLMLFANSCNNLFTVRGRIFWGSSNKALDLSWRGSSADGTEVGIWEHKDTNSDPWRIWKLVPVLEEELGAKKDEALPVYSKKQ